MQKNIRERIEHFAEVAHFIFFPRKKSVEKIRQFSSGKDEHGKNRKNPRRNASVFQTKPDGNVVHYENYRRKNQPQKCEFVGSFHGGSLVHFENFSNKSGL
jgi:hypothetical protein